MTIQNYCMIDKDNNICENIVVWDGNPNTWTPPSNYLMLVQATTLTKIWTLNTDKTQYVLTNSIGQGDIGWTWDGTYLTTNEPQPLPPQPQTASPEQPVTNLQSI